MQQSALRVLQVEPLPRGHCTPHYGLKYSLSQNAEQGSLIHRRGSSASHRIVSLQAKRQQFATFDDMLLGSDQPVLVDFSARWCGPCQMMSGVLAVSIEFV